MSDIEIPDFYSMSNEEIYTEWGTGLTYIGGGEDYSKMYERLGIPTRQLGDSEIYVPTEEEGEDMLERVTDAFYEEVTRRAPCWIRVDKGRGWGNLDFPDKLLDLWEEADVWWWEKDGDEISPSFCSVGTPDGQKACLRWGIAHKLFDDPANQLAMHLGCGVMHEDMEEMREYVKKEWPGELE